MLKFVKNFLLDFKSVGSIVPSSKYLAKKMIENIDINGKYKILEVGSGTGSVTDVILKELNEENDIYASELNKDFCDILKKKFNNRIKIIEGNILDFNPINKEFDYIVCCLPFNSIEFKETKKIYDHLFKLLKKDGNLIIFEYRVLCNLNYNKKYRNYKKNYLSKYLLEYKKENKNFPPANIRIYKKNG